MRTISIERSNLAQSAIVSLVTFAALVLLGVVLAYWTWAWFAPAAEPPAPSAEVARGSAVGPTQAAFGLFGSAQRERSGVASAGHAVRLLGVVAAAGGQPSYAVLRIDAKQTVAVREGGEVEPGVRLAEVHADHVVLERGGVRAALAWPERTRTAVSAAQRTNH